MPASLEVELKLRAEDDVPLRHLAEVDSLAGWRLGPAREVDETDRYLDTADRRLSSRAWACRLRTREGVTLLSLKGPPEHASGEAVHRRAELEGPADAVLDPVLWAPSAARSRLLELSAGEALHEWIVLSQRRVERVVEPDHRVGVLSLDRVRVLRDGTQRGEFAVVELELAAGADERELALMADALRATPGLQPEPRTKLERALELAPDGG
jgi:inorganic triphosphatase YgiF